MVKFVVANFFVENMVLVPLWSELVRGTRCGFQLQSKGVKMSNMNESKIGEALALATALLALAVACVFVPWWVVLGIVVVSFAVAGG